MVLQQAKSVEERATGCLLAAAYGDMLGASVEFMTTSSIRARYGSEGICVPAPSFGFPFPVLTDDTQMALATGSGLVRAGGAAASDAEILARVWEAYGQWYASQSDPNQQRAPGGTCMSAIGRGVMGSVMRRINDSCGCGGVMRVHPVGIALRDDIERAYRIGLETAAQTHGHPDGYVPAGFMAVIVAQLMRGESIMQAFDSSLRFLWDKSDGAVLGTKRVIDEALHAPIDNVDHARIIDTQVGQSIPGRGGGWLGHDAVAVALYAVRASPDDPLKAIRIAVNHSGDSDSTGSMAGAILGTFYGPDPFLAHLAAHSIEMERHQELVELARALARSP